MSVRDQLVVLNGGLGPTLVAALAGVKDTKLPIRWSKSDGPRPSVIYERRLLAAYRAWTEIERSEGRSIARRWFIGGNPLLDEATPITALREDRSPEVLRAATAFVRGDIDE